MTLLKKIPLSRKDLWLCDCGNTKEMRSDGIISGKVKSCGCGMHTKKMSVPKYISRAFTLMKYRCNNKNSSDYANYGGRGIEVLYKDYDEFYADVGERPADNHTVDRKDNSKHYEVGNCRWASQETQANNTRKNRAFIVYGIRKTVAQLSKEYNMGYTTLKARIDSGMDIMEALTKKIAKKKSHTRRAA